MALQSGLDTVAIVSFGVYSETYGSGEGSNIANLVASFGYLEDAPNITSPIDKKGWYRIGMSLTTA